MDINSFSALSMSVPTMKAVRVHRFGGPEVLSLEHNVPIPPLKENQVVHGVVKENQVVHGVKEN